MLSDEWLSRYGLLENFNASVTRTRTRTGTRTGTGTGTGTWTTGVTAIALCTSCSRAKNSSFKLAIFCSPGQFVSDLLGNPEDQFFHVAAHLIAEDIQMTVTVEKVFFPKLNNIKASEPPATILEHAQLGQYELHLDIAGPLGFRSGIPQTRHFSYR